MGNVRVSFHDLGIDVSDPVADEGLGGVLCQGVRDKAVPKGMQVAAQPELFEHSLEVLQ